MSIDLCDGIILAGAILFITGVYLWLGMPAMLMTAGAVLVYVGARLDIAAIGRAKHDEPD